MNEVSMAERDRQLLLDAQRQGWGTTIGAYVKLSGPGWLQSAITLGGGSLAGALFLGVLGGTSMLWLQLLAIAMGVVMLSAISYVTLSTGRRPFETINSEINPALGWGWLSATILANIIWCMPQFALCYTALDKNLVPVFSGSTGGLGPETGVKFISSALLLAAASIIVGLNARRGVSARIFDWFLKALVGMIVICFFGVVILLALRGRLNFEQIVAGFIPDFRQWTQPSGQIGALLAGLSPEVQRFWSDKIVLNQRTVMIAAAATAVGINMTFLLPYSMLGRGWDKPFRGLARFDLSTGMAIPYILVTSCVVIASAATFHAQIDENLASHDPLTMQESPSFAKIRPALLERLAKISEPPAGVQAVSGTTSDDSQLASLAAMPEVEKRLALSLVQRNAFELSQTLAPLLGERLANLVFGLGVFGMGFSTIIILMLINGYAFQEMCDRPGGRVPFVAGCAVAGIAGASWPYFWAGDTQFWLAIFASTFGMMLLPIAYVTFFLMMNSQRILGDEKPRGVAMLVWNTLMIISIAGAVVAAATAIYDKAMDREHPAAFYAIMALIVVYGLLVGGGFIARRDKCGVQAA